jgi:hypothetical protein
LPLAGKVHRLAVDEPTLPVEQQSEEDGDVASLAERVALEPRLQHLAPDRNAPALSPFWQAILRPA